MSEPIGVHVYGTEAGLDRASDQYSHVWSLEGQATLIALLSPAFASDLPPATCQDVFEAIEAAVKEQSGSDACQLDAAMQAANALLFEHNLRTDAEHQVLAGVAVALWKKTYVTVAVLGPVCAAGFANGELYQVRALNAAGTANGFWDATGVAGLEPHTSPRLFRLPLAANDGLLLALDSPDLAIRDLLACVVGSTPSDGLARWAELVDGQGSFGVFVSSLAPQDLRLPASTAPSLRVEFLDLPSQSSCLVPENEMVEGERIQDIQEPVAEPEIKVELEPLDKVELQPQQECVVLAETEDEITTVPSPALPFDDETLADGSLPSEGEVDDDFSFPWESDEVYEDTALTLADEDDNIDEAVPEKENSSRPERLCAMREVWNKATMWCGQSIHRVEEWAVGVLPEELSQRPEVPKKEKVALSGRALVLIAMAIPVVMLVFVLITRVQYDRAIEAQFDTVQLAAQDAYQMADSASDPSVQRQYLEEALLQADQGLAMRPENEVLSSLRTRVEHELDEINAVERIYTFYKLAEVDEYSASVSDSARIFLQDQDLFLLHRGSDCVYHYEMNQVGDALEPVGVDPLLIQKGQVYDGTVAAELVDMAWIQEGGLRGSTAFTVLDRAGTLYVVDEQLGVMALPVANSQTWRQPKAMAGYFGNLYVLDTLLGSLLKYEPVDDAYTRAPSSYMDASLGVDLTGAVDLAVDGNMYILFADGHIGKYYDGVQVPFNSLSVPQSMLNPTAIFVSGDQEPDAEGFVYVADAGNARIVQFDKNGNYVRQLQAKIGGVELDDVRGLYVDEDTQRIIVLSGRSLWLGTLPPM